MAYQTPPPPPVQHHGVGPQPTNGLAIASMVLGIVGVFLFVFFAIVSILALVFGLVANGQINRSGGTQPGKGMAIAGIVLGLLEDPCVHRLHRGGGDVSERPRLLPFRLIGCSAEQATIGSLGAAGG